MCSCRSSLYSPPSSRASRCASRYTLSSTGCAGGSPPTPASTTWESSSSTRCCDVHVEALTGGFAVCSRGIESRVVQLAAGKAFYLAPRRPVLSARCCPSCCWRDTVDARADRDGCVGGIYFASAILSVARCWQALERRHRRPAVSKSLRGFTTFNASWPDREDLVAAAMSCCPGILTAHPAVSARAPGSLHETEQPASAISGHRT